MCANIYSERIFQDVRKEKKGVKKRRDSESERDKQREEDNMLFFPKH